MPYFVSKDLTIEKAYPLKGVVLDNFRCIPDTEYTQKKFMNVDCIGLHSPELIADKTLIFTREELTKNFHPIYEILKYAGIEFEPLSEDSLETLTQDLETLNEIFRDDIEGLNGRTIRKLFNTALNDGEFDPFLKTWGLQREHLSIERIRDYEGANYYIIVKPKEVNAQLGFFFAPADLCKIYGQNHQSQLLDSKLYQFRSLRFLEKPTIYLLTSQGLINLRVELRDTMYRLPPVDKSLAGQAKAFDLSGTKLEVDCRETAVRLGLEDPNQIKENMSTLFEAMPEESIKYNAQDLFLTSELDDTQRKFLSVMRNSFGLDPTEIADTTGKNVSTMIQDIVFKHYGLNPDNDEDKTSVRAIKRLFKIGKGENVQKISSNHFGIQPFLTVGGLLFSRMAKYPSVEGLLGDLDLKSCYATAMSNMSVYFGEPKCLTFRYKKFKPSLRDGLELIKNESAPNDGWFIRVSGKLEKAINTLILSDLKFTPKKDYIQEKSGIPTSRKSIEQFNAEKTSKKQATSTILLKEIKFGLINHNVLEALNLLPKDWLEEYLDLKVDAIVYYPGEMIVDTLEAYFELTESLSEEPEKEELNQDKRSLVTETQHYKNNVVLRFPIAQYWGMLKDERNKLKKAKDPVQSVYKLAQNSGYGAFACMYLAINNLVASNMITSMARTNCWLMLYALNGFSPITDGTCFSWENLPLGKKFRELVTENPSYVYSYSPNIESGIDKNLVGQNWIDTDFKKHLASFFDIPETHYLVKLFDYELKDESFLTKEGEEVLESWSESLDYVPTEKEKSQYLSGLAKENGKSFYIVSTEYNRYINTNGANYVKGLDKSSVLIDDYEYDLNSQTGQIKARSYSSKRDKGLLPWFLESVTEGYYQPYIYEENQVIKFGEGNNLAIKYLQELDREISHPMGFSSKIVKLMKLVSRSQFLFLNESQLRNFETNETSLAHLSKVRVGNKRPLLDDKFWHGLKSADLEEYGVELRPGLDYGHYSKSHPVGTGFELLALNRNHKGSLKSLRVAIQDKILEGCKDFNGAFQVQRSINYANNFKNLLAAVIVKRKNYEEDLKQILIESAEEPTLLLLKPENITTLAKLWGYSEDE